MQQPTYSVRKHDVSKSKRRRVETANTTRRLYEVNVSLHFSPYFPSKGCDLKEAKEYMKNEILAARLREITNALLEHTDKRAEDILGYVDDMKVKSSMTLFDAVCPGNVFEKVLEQFYGGERCERTLRIIGNG